MTDPLGEARDPLERRFDRTQPPSLVPPTPGS